MRFNPINRYFGPTFEFRTKLKVERVEILARCLHVVSVVLIRYLGAQNFANYYAFGVNRLQWLADWRETRSRLIALTL